MTRYLYGGTVYDLVAQPGSDGDLELERDPLILFGDPAGEQPATSFLLADQTGAYVIPAAQIVPLASGYAPRFRGPDGAVRLWHRPLVGEPLKEWVALDAPIAGARVAPGGSGTTYLSDDGTFRAPPAGTGGGTGTGNVTSVNGQTGEAALSVGDLTDVTVPTPQYDDEGNIVVPGPAVGDALRYDVDGHFRPSATPVGSHEHPEHAPAGYRPPYFQPVYVGDPALVPADFPVGGLIVDPANLPTGLTIKAADPVAPVLVVPDAPTGVAVEASTTSPETTMRIKWTTATVPAGGPPVTEFRLYRDGTHIRTDPAALASGAPRTFVFDNTLTRVTTYTWRVAAVNADGIGPLSAAVSGATAGAGGPPAAPANLRLVGAARAKAVDLAWDAAVPDPTDPTTGYEVLLAGDTAPLLVVGNVLAGTVTGLTAGTAYSMVVRAVNANGAGPASAALPVTTAAAAGTAVIPRTDFVAETLGFNDKASYVTGTHGATQAQADANISHATGMGFRIYRESVAKSGTSRTRQHNFIDAMHTAHGTRYHTTIGKMRNTPEGNVPQMTAAQLRVHAATVVAAELAEISSAFYQGLAGAGNTLSRILHSIAGPNEFHDDTPDGSGPDVGPNWARNVRIWQEQIWRGVREGKFWVVSGGVGGFQVTEPDFPTRFGSVIVAGPCGRTNMTLAMANLAAGPYLSGTSGPREISQWVEMGNIHHYNGSEGSPSRGIDDALAVALPLLGDASKPSIITEAGYVHMGFTRESVWVGPPDFKGAHAGQRRIPPWAIATYMPRAVVNHAARGIGWIIHEFLDDTDPGTSAAGQPGWDQEGFFGTVTTPSLDPATWQRLPHYYALQRLFNLCRDRADVKVPPTHGTAPLPHAITDNGGAGTLLETDPANSSKMFCTQKADGHWWAFLSRDVVVWKFDTSGQQPGDPDPAGPGVELPVADKTVTIRLDHTSGTRTVRRWRPNKASAATPVGSTASWSTIPAAEQTWTVAAGGSFDVVLGANLEVLEIF